MVKGLCHGEGFKVRQTGLASQVAALHVFNHLINQSMLHVSHPPTSWGAQRRARATQVAEASPNVWTLHTNNAPTVGSMFPLVLMFVFSGARGAIMWSGLVGDLV